MASIENVRLEIVERNAAAAVLVTYSLVGSPEDIQQRRSYSETVELIGVDEGAGEDGRNETIRGSRSDEQVTFPLATPERRRLLALQASALDEDQPFNPFSPVPHPDEIRARVTLTLFPSTTVSALSATLVLHK